MGKRGGLGVSAASGGLRVGGLMDGWMDGALYTFHQNLT